MAATQGRREEYKGHRIELRPPKEDARGAPVLLIDDAPIPYGRFPDGQYSSHELAYEWHDDLVEVGRRLIDHRDKADKRRREGQAEGGA